MRSLRITQYQDEFFKYIHEYYKTDINCVLCTYYHFDLENSICDKDMLKNGAYQFTGNLSGYRWKKIELFPINFLAPIDGLDVKGTENGVTYTSVTSAVIPSTYNMEPTTNDILYFNSGFLLGVDENQTTFRIEKVDRSNIGKDVYYKVTLVSEYYHKEKFDEKSDEFVFVEYEKKIYPKAVATEMIKLLGFEYSISDLLNSRYNFGRGFYETVV